MARPFRFLGKAFALVRDRGQAQWHPGGMGFKTNLTVVHLDADGRQISKRNLGSGVTTVIGTGGTGPFNSTDAFFDLTWGVSATAWLHMGSGTGTSVASSSNTNLQTAIAGNLAVSNTAVSGATVTYTGSIGYSGSYSVSEWAAFLINQASPIAWSSGMFCFDRRTFTPIDVSAGQSLVFIYALTLVAGG